MKKYDFQFRNETSDGTKELMISTDDVDSLADALWFKEFIGLKQDVRSQDMIRELLHQVDSLRNALQDERRKQQPQQQQVLHSVQPVQQVSVQQEPVQQVQQTQSLPPVPIPPPPIVRKQSTQQQQQRISSPGFLSVSPDQMNESLWKSLSEAQREQWFEKWEI